MRNIKIEKMRYQENKSSYNLALVAFLINQYYLVTSLNSLAITYHIGIEIAINLMTFMFMFLGMERVKDHDEKWSKYFMGLAGFDIVRILYMPRMLFVQANELIQTGDTISIETGKSILLAGYKSAGALIVMSILILISGIIGYRKASALKKYYGTK
ncbi:hypothetical protein [Fusibacter sp. 3D3]|uniref:hypothetical protein n=1 Tax=Fusibacter sp. 3D3 TaxID=1048380 RepID=UPI0008536555|nr:hypothetical protein [Fusibacter sp. 3D3]GAU75744.1 hypothetical protein F3D3_0335 [Fusibacter sp. 3D3]